MLTKSTPSDVCRAPPAVFALMAACPAELDVTLTVATPDAFVVAVLLLTVPSVLLKKTTVPAWATPLFRWVTLTGVGVPTSISVAEAGVVNLKLVPETLMPSVLVAPWPVAVKFATPPVAEVNVADMAGKLPLASVVMLREPPVRLGELMVTGAEMPLPLPSFSEP